jgi:hypothetical protein
MKTAEVAIEHVLTGLLALCAFLLPLLSGLQVNEKLLQSEALIGVLGLAYLFGVVFDRLADTILSPIEQRIRLRLANEALKRSEAGKEAGNPGDPFPQDILEFSLRAEQNGRVDWMDSLRSRIRTSRGLAVFGLPAAMGLAIFLSADRQGYVRWDWWPHLAVGLNLIFMSMAIFLSSIRIPKDQTSSEGGDTQAQVDVPRWFQWISNKMKRIKANPHVEKLKSVGTTDLLDKTIHRETLMYRSTRRMLICCFFYLLMLLTSAITVATIVLWPSNWLARGVIVFAVVILTALPIMAWYRITETHMSFISRKLPEFLDEKTVPARRLSSRRLGNPW